MQKYSRFRPVLVNVGVFLVMFIHGSEFLIIILAFHFCIQANRAINQSSLKMVTLPTTVADIPSCSSTDVIVDGF